MSVTPIRLPRVLPGLVAASGGLVCLALPGETSAAIGAELLAAAFWLWSRTGEDRREQLARWGWLRRPAMALWLAAALAIALPAPSAPPIPDVFSATGETTQLSELAPRTERDPVAPLRTAEAFAVLWAALELLGALPLSRPYPDLTGPLPNAGAWLPAVLPAAGFLVLWRLSPVWTAAPWLRELAQALLLLAAVVAVLRAYVRRSWTASLRWLAVFDSAFAGLLVALDAVPGEIAFLLWFAAAGGRLVALASEVRGASERRGPGLAALWRAASWTAGATLAWPLLLVAGFGGGRFHPVPLVLLAAPAWLAATVSRRRMVEAPERRAVSRRDPARAVSVVAALATLALGPLALLLAWWGGLEASFPGVLVAFAPALLALLPRRASGRASAVWEASVAAGASARDFALAVYRSVTSAERAVAGGMGGALRALAAPLRDLHTGDAQEYLLFLVGVAVLALLLPLFR
jgi:hypothetical protein